MYLYVIFGMFLGHLLDDYVLQQVLAKLKQKKFWEENAPDKLYEKDYIMGLFCHSLEWSIMIHIAPFLYIVYVGLANNYPMAIIMTFSIVINTAIHMIIDNIKANKLKISLIEDQLWHFLQILVTCLIIGISATSKI